MTEENQNPIYVSGIKFSHYTCLEEFELKPEQVTIIVGPNGSGKTSVLNGLVDGLSKGGIDPDSIHFDADRAEVRIALSDTTEIQRVRIREGGSRLKVERGDAVLKSPQRVLSELLDLVQLDPVAWLDGDRTTALLDSMPLRVTAEDLHALYQEAGVKASARTIPADLDTHAVKVLASIEAGIAKERKERNAEVKQIKGWLENERAALGAVEDPTPKIDEAQTEQTKVAGKLAEARSTALRISEAVKNKETAGASLDRQASTVIGLRERVSELQTQLEDAEKEEKERTTVNEASEISLAKLEKATPDIDATVSELEVLATNTAAGIETLKEQRGAWDEAIKQKGRVEDEAERLEGVKVQVSILNAAVKVFRAAPADLLAKADLPVDGLSFDDGRLTLNKVPVSKLSGAETVRLAVRIAEHRAHAKKGQFVLLDGLEKLDKVQRAALLEEVSNSDVQWIMTEVGIRGDAGDALVVVMGSDGGVVTGDENGPEDANQGASGDNGELWEKQHSEMAKKHPGMAQKMLDDSASESEGSDDDASA